MAEGRFNPNAKKEKKRTLEREEARIESPKVTTRVGFERETISLVLLSNSNSTPLRQEIEKYFKVVLYILLVDKVDLYTLVVDKVTHIHGFMMRYFVSVKKAFLLF